MKVKDVKKLEKLNRKELITLLFRIKHSNPHSIDEEYLRDLIKHKKQT